MFTTADRYLNNKKKRLNVIITMFIISFILFIYISMYIAFHA